MVELGHAERGVGACRRSGDRGPCDVRRAAGGGPVPGRGRLLRRGRGGPAGALLRYLPQRQPAHGGAHAGGARCRQPGRPGGGLGKGRAEAAGRHDAPARPAAPGSADVRPPGVLPRGGARPHRRGRARPGAQRRAAPPQRHRVPERDPRSARPRDRRRGSAAGRRFERRIRQRGSRRPRSGPDGTLPERGPQDQPAGRRRSRALGGRRHLHRAVRPESGPSRGGSALRHARRRHVPLQLSGRRRVRGARRAREELEQQPGRRAAGAARRRHHAGRGTGAGPDRPSPLPARPVARVAGSVRPARPQRRRRPRGARAGRGRRPHGGRGVRQPGLRRGRTAPAAVPQGAHNGRRRPAHAAGRLLAHDHRPPRLDGRGRHAESTPHLHLPAGARRAGRARVRPRTSSRPWPAAPTAGR